MTITDISKILHIDFYHTKKAINKWRKMLPEFVNVCTVYELKEWQIQTNGNIYIIKVKSSSPQFKVVCKVAKEYGMLKSRTIKDNEINIEIYGDERIFDFLIRIFQRHLGYKFVF